MHFNAAKQLACKACHFWSGDSHYVRLFGCAGLLRHVAPGRLLYEIDLERSSEFTGAYSMPGTYKL